MSELKFTVSVTGEMGKREAKIHINFAPPLDVQDNEAWENSGAGSVAHEIITAIKKAQAEDSEAEFVEVGSVLFCPNCRKAYVGKGHSLNDKCPGCGEAHWFAVMNASRLLDDIENSEALGVVIDCTNDEVVAEVASIMGFRSGCCTDIREGRAHMERLRAFKAAL